MLKAAAYARYSTDNQTDNSIAYQLNGILEYCRQNNITVTKTYIDEAQSGTNADRQGFIDMVSAAQRKEFECVVIYDISRGSRDVADWFSFRKTMQQLNILIISATEKLGDISNPNDFLVELINVGLGQHMVLQTRQKSIAGVATKAKEGKFLGGVAPLGYDIKDGNYVINPHEAKIVNKIFTMYAEGNSYNDILNQFSGIKGKRGRPIGKNSLYSILKNERYIGTYTWNKYKMKSLGKWAGGTPNPNVVKIEDAIPVIINTDIWERVQKRMQDNKINATNKAKREYLLRGLIECDKCGSTFVGHCSKNPKGVEYRQYVCGNKYRTKTCDACTINADEIETFVVMQLKSYLLNTNFDEVAEQIADAVNSGSPNLSAEKKELAELTTQINNGLKYILSGKNFPELQDEVDRLRVRKSELEDIISRSTVGKKVDKEKIVDMFKKSCEDFSTNLKGVIQDHITKIYAHADGSFSVNVGVHTTGCGTRI